MNNRIGLQTWQWIRPSLLLLILVPLTLLLTKVDPHTAAAAPDNSGAPIYGVNFITAAESPADEQQYQNGLSTGAGWNRWPLYWFNIETSQGVFDWAAQDTAVIADIAHGLQTNAILLGTPSFYTTSFAGKNEPSVSKGGFVMQRQQAATPAGLYDPIFTDGTDIPGPGKQINDNNKWARFVETAVNRYRPGGALAQQQGWPGGVGVTHWEVWNEPDLNIFWDSSLADYARLLKVGYIVIKQRDPDATVLFAGLANNMVDPSKFTYYDDVLNIYDQDGLAASNNYFHDILATHNYSCSWRSWYHVYRAGQTMAVHGLDKPIWLNENGVPAWDDYPGPVWDATSGFRASMAEQASFVIQSALYATFAGADAVFQFQLYDGCGNQPAYTDFPPHNGELCDANGMLISDPTKPCAGDANGLFRNPTDATCFTQHPQPESARPSLAAYQTLAAYFQNATPIWRSRPGSGNLYDGPQEIIAFFRGDTGQRVVGLWMRTGETQTAVINATHSSGSAILVSADGTTQNLTAVNNQFNISLPAATNQNATCNPDSSPYAIGGRPYLLIETDDMAPEVSITSDITNTWDIDVAWSSRDMGSAVQQVDVSVAIDGGPPQPWLTDTNLTTAVYNGASGHIYQFTITASDGAGNTAVASDTAVTVTLNPEAFLPFVTK